MGRLTFASLQVECPYTPCVRLERTVSGGYITGYGYGASRQVKCSASHLDWMQCALIEKIPGKVSGRPIVRGTRILADAIVDSHDLGETIDELVSRTAGFDR